MRERENLRILLTKFFRSVVQNITVAWLFVIISVSLSLYSRWHHCALKACKRATLSVRSLLKVVLETVPMLVWLNTYVSHKCVSSLWVSQAFQCILCIDASSLAYVELSAWHTLSLDRMWRHFVWMFSGMQFLLCTFSPWNLCQRSIVQAWLPALLSLQKVISGFWFGRTNVLAWASLFECTLYVQASVHMTEQIVHAHPPPYTHTHTHTSMQHIHTHTSTQTHTHTHTCACLHTQSTWPASPNP